MEFLPLLQTSLGFLEYLWRAIESMGLDRVIIAIILMAGIAVWSVIIMLIEGAWYIIYKIRGKKTC